MYETHISNCIDENVYKELHIQHTRTHGRMDARTHIHTVVLLTYSLKYKIKRQPSKSVKMTSLNGEVNVFLVGYNNKEKIISRLLPYFYCFEMKQMCIIYAIKTRYEAM